MQFFQVGDLRLQERELLGQLLLARGSRRRPVG